MKFSDLKSALDIARVAMIKHISSLMELYELKNPDS